MDHIHIIAVLAHGQASRVDRGTQIRIERAVERVREVTLTDRRREVVLMFMAGTGKELSQFTLAERMALYARECIERAGIDDRNLRLRYNRYDREVWSTIEEIEWAEQEARKRYHSVHLEYVTNERHGCRVKCTAVNLDYHEPTVVVSDDPPPPILHEVCAYLKLAIYPLRPLYQSLQFLRRNGYNGG